MAWNDNQDGRNLNTAWEAMRSMYNTWIIQHKQRLQNAANRPLGG